MNTPNHKLTADVIDCLTQLKGPKLASRRKGRRVQYRVFMTEAEHRALIVMGVTIAFHVGRKVSMPLVNRLALECLSERCLKSLKDPVEAAKLRADILAVREERMTRRTDV